MTQIVCGVDVASDHLDARIGRNGATLRVANKTAGIAELAAFCRNHGVDIVAMEATGGYERLAFGLLWDSAIPCAVLNPRSVRRFAEAMGQFEKTDRLDAAVIAWYGETKNIRPQRPPDAVQRQLAALVTRLRQITDTLVLQQNQRCLVTEAEVLASIDEVTGLLRRQAKDFEAKIAALIEVDPLWSELDRAFRSIKGVAGRTVARLLAELNEIGTLSNKAVTKLVGLAPIARDSGKIAGKRPIRGGRSTVRSILFVVAIGVSRYDEDFAAFRKRLADAGKPKKVIRIALAHKLLVRLNAKARDVRKELAMPA